MPLRQPIKMIDVSTALGRGELGAFAFDMFERRCLAVRCHRSSRPT
jgi:hypothetical protein